MIQITDREKCCGCNACGDICPQKAITFKIDIEGFWYPEINKDSCVDCHLCEKICPIINIQDLKKNDYSKPNHTIAAVNRNMQVRWNSTSGGAYTAFAEAMLEQGGYISGAVYNEGFTGVHNYVTNHFEDLERLRSSKYLQSNAEGIYSEIKRLLTQGEKVMACGTPCQMAALRSFLRKDYDNLIIIDFICRGVNSPKVYRAYLDSLEKKYNSKIIQVKAKNKELGWRNLTRKVSFENGQSYYGVFMDDDFRRGYHTNVFCRPSCYDCQFKGFPRIADITLADFWGIERVDNNLDDDIGTSMILLNSKKGEQFFASVKDKLVYREVAFDTIFGGNKALISSITPSSINRHSFFADLDKNGFEYVKDLYFPLQTKISLKSRIKAELKKYVEIYRTLGLNLGAYINTIILNSRKNTISNFSKKQYLLVSPNVTFDIHPSAKIKTDGFVSLGQSEVKKFWLPTCLKMTKGTELNFHVGPLTRYGNDLRDAYTLRSGAYIEIINNGKLTIGQGACNVNLNIMCTEEITIGNGVRIGRNVSIRDYNGKHVIVDDHYQTHAPVHVGDHCWLCSGCTIMPGVNIGEGSVIAANAVVTKDVPPHSLVGGVPAKVLRNNIEWY